MADYVGTWLIIFMQPLSGMSITHRNKGLQARVKFDTRNAQEWFLLLFNPQKDNKFPWRRGKKKRGRGSASPTCPSSDPGSGCGHGGQSRGSAPAARSPSGSDRPAPAAWPRASTGHPACARAHISSNPTTTSPSLLPHSTQELKTYVP